MNQVEFESEYGRIRNEENVSLFDKNKPDFLCRQVWKKIQSCVPMLHWLPHYSFRECFHGDLITGLTVGIMVVPQAMAYATLAGLEPVYGLYSCFFAALIYMFFGTSRHVSIGTFAVASMMVATVHTQILNNLDRLQNITLHKLNSSFDQKVAFGDDLTPIMITSALTFGVGICQLIMAVCRLSFLTNYISDPLVSGFTTGAAVHVLFSQLDKAIGVKVEKHHGAGMIIKMTIGLIRALPSTNIWTLGITLFSITFLSIGRDYINPWFKAKYRIPLPLELFLVVMSIIFSQVLDIKELHLVKIVDHVPEGLPVPSLPRLDLMLYLWKDAISISVICYIFVFSMGKIFAKKHKYKTDCNQELYALGICQVLSAFFPVYPSGASLSRSSLCEMTGAKTQLHALFSSALLLIVILWLGRLLEPLPMAVLACIVMVSLKSLFLQFKELPKLCKISMIDFAIWIVAFVATVLIDVTSGLIISIAFVILSVVVREQWPKFNQIHATPNKGIFRPADIYKNLVPITDPIVSILRFEAPLHFANASKFIDRSAEVMAKMCSSNPTSVSSHAAQPAATDLLTLNTTKLESSTMSKSADILLNESSGSLELSDENTTRSSKLSSSADISKKDCKPIPCRMHLVVDCSAIAYLDSMGVEAVWEVFSDGANCGISVKYADFSDTVLETFTKCGLFDSIPKTNFYPTVREAITGLGKLE